MRRTILLNEEDKNKLVEMYQRAQTTPVITVGLGHKDAATMAWDEVREFMEELGKKYDFNPHTMVGINPNTGEIIV